MYSNFNYKKCVFYIEFFSTPSAIEAINASQITGD